MWRSTLELVPLSAEDRRALAVHLLALDADDRYARFGCTLGDAALRNWVRDISWPAQRWWGWRRRTGAGLLAALQLVPTAEPGAWELALSVQRPVRRLGLGSALLSAAVCRADTELHCLLGHHGHGALVAMGRRLGYGVQLSGQPPRVRLQVGTRGAPGEAEMGQG
ncbi:hypothetical protein [Hydrogenophaga sp. NFH-34]|uniref:hypothetical protein n=1 Tax=Hydrogenophaga sp. NFH-34 TaxID=2744446 RepID=UPI001F367E66|nr:hypothetical protein [Hydrogenophaga sp. NFH-34]